MIRYFKLSTRKFSDLSSNFKPFKETKWFMPNGNPTGISVYNCMADEKVPLILSNPHVATWYSCGPTVYESAHIGHASCYVKLDIIQRILESFFNIKLVTAMGITDIDDKIIKKANEKNTSYKTIAKEYEGEFWRDMVSLNVQKPMIITRVTDHINTIEQFIKKLIDCSAAYIVDDGSVYFDVNKFSFYGKFKKVQDSGEPPSLYKRNITDFALWKGQKPDEPAWETSWGKGRPGWHIECSAMVSKIFGAQIDFHAGGIDLQFPHHENEEAQSCAFHNTMQWANYWLHVGHLHMKKDVKMSKSLENTISIPSLLNNFSADTFRMACLLSNYRYPMEYSDELMRTAEDVLNKFKFFFIDANVYVNNNHKQNGSYQESMLEKLAKSEELVLDALKSDFNTAASIDILMNLMNITNKVMNSSAESYHPVPVLLITEYIQNTLNKFGLRLEDVSQTNVSNALIDILVDFRRNIRAKALETQDTELLTYCDIVRGNLKSLNIKVLDKKTGPSWVYVK